jgi:zinc transport system substrate-binding protein
MTTLARAFRRHLRFAPLAALLPVVGLACGEPADRESAPTVLVSVLPHAGVVERLAGERVRVEVLIPPGASPATYEPTVRQLKLASEADLLVIVGHPNLPFERTWLPQLIGEREDLPVVRAAGGAVDAGGDPHVWLDPGRMGKAAEAIAEALVATFPETADSVRTALAAFQAEVVALDAELRELLAPYAGKRFLVFHPAWGHFARAYGLEQVAIEQGEKEPSPEELATIIDAAKAEGMRAVFVQPQFSHHSARIVAEEAGLSVVSLDPLARDWADNLRKSARTLVARW